MTRQDYRTYAWFTALVSLIGVLTIVVNAVNGRFHPGDFQVYYTAAQRFATDEPVYLVSFYSGSGLYKYSPATLFFFLPYTLLPYEMGALLHSLLLTAAYAACFILLYGIVRDYLAPAPVRKPAWLLVLSFVCILVPMNRELYLGNINMVLLLFCLLSIRAFTTGHTWQGGWWLALSILAKPYLAILLLPLILRGRWKETGITGLGIVTGLLLPFLRTGITGGVELYASWVETIRIHGSDFPGMTSLGYLAGRYIPGWPSQGDILPAAAIVAAVSLFILRNRQSERQSSRPVPGRTNQVFEWFLLLGLLPSMIRTDWVLLLFTAPLIMFSIFTVAGMKARGWIPVLAILIFVYGANSDDLLGRELSRQVLHSGLMGVANFLLVTVAAILFVRYRGLVQPHP